MSNYCSVIIPCKNRHGIISKAVESAVTIDAVDEVIVVDDTSSPAIIYDLFIDIPFLHKLKILSNSERSGAQGARVTGAKASKNDIIIFLDSDDVLLKEGVDNLFSSISRSTDIAMVYGNVKTKGWTSDFLRLNGFVFLNILRNLCLCPFSGLCVRKSLVEWDELDLTLPAWQDDDFVLTVSRKNKIEFVDTYSAMMSFSNDNISRHKYRQYLGLTILLRKWKREIVNHLGWPRLFLWRVRQLTLMLSSIEQYSRNRKNGNKYRQLFFRLIGGLSRRCAEYLSKRVRRHFDRIYA